MIPGSGRSPGKENGYPFQYSCLGNSIKREAWQATVHGVGKESDTTEQLSMHTQVECILKPVLVTSSTTTFNPFVLQMVENCERDGNTRSF